MDPPGDAAEVDPKMDVGDAPSPKAGLDPLPVADVGVLKTEFVEADAADVDVPKIDVVEATEPEDGVSKPVIGAAVPDVPKIELVGLPADGVPNTLDVAVPGADVPKIEPVGAVGPEEVPKTLPDEAGSDAEFPKTELVEDGPDVDIPKIEVLETCPAPDMPNREDIEAPVSEAGAPKTEATDVACS